MSNITVLEPEILVMEFHAQRPEILGCVLMVTNVGVHICAIIVEGEV